jgi:hypothetical protein
MPLDKRMKTKGRRLRSAANKVATNVRLTKIDMEFMLHFCELEHIKKSDYIELAVRNLNEQKKELYNVRVLKTQRRRHA